MAIILTPGQNVAGPDWEAVFQQHGGSKSQVLRPPTKAEIEGAPPEDDFDQNPIYRYYAADGSYVEARKSPTGDYQIVAYQPSAKFQQAQPKSGSADDPAARNAAILQAQREKNAGLPKDQDPRYETDEERADRATATIKQQGADERSAAAEARAAQDQANQQADRNKPGAPQIKDDGKGGSIAIQAMPDGTIRTTPLPNVPSNAPSVTIDGVPYQRGPDGRYAPLPGAPTGAYTGPSLPQIITGHAAATLQAIGAQIMSDTSLTPAARERMWGQMVQVANVAVQEAGIKQREAESNLNASVNLATGKLTAEQNAMTNALKVASDINDKLPVGSDLGGQAFAAMLGMSLITAHRSGIYDIKLPGTPVTDASARPAPRPLPFNPADRAAVEAQRQQVQQQLQQAQQPAAAVTQPAPGAGAAPGGTSPLPGADTAVAGGERYDDILTFDTPSDGVTQMTRVQFDALSPDQQRYYRGHLTNAQRPGPAATPPAAPAGGRDYSDTVTVRSPEGAELDVPRHMVGEGPGQYRESQGWVVIRDPKASAGAIPSPVPMPDVPVQASDVPPSVPMPEPRPDQTGIPPPVPMPSFPVGPEPGAPSRDISAPGVPNTRQISQTPVPDFAALSRYQPQAMPVAAAPPDMLRSPAMLQARAASTVPWRLSDQEIAEMEAAGIDPSIIYSVPGMPSRSVA